MTLKESAALYRSAGDLLRQRLAHLRRKSRSCGDAQELFRLRRRIASLTEALTQINELTELTEHYYERGYYRNEKYRI